MQKEHIDFHRVNIALHNHLVCTHLNNPFLSSFFKGGRLSLPFTGALFNTGELWVAVPDPGLSVLSWYSSSAWHSGLALFGVLLEMGFRCPLHIFLPESEKVIQSQMEIPDTQTRSHAHTHTHTVA